MIFSGERNGVTHIGMILIGDSEFRAHVDYGKEEPVIKTQTRRWSPIVPTPKLYEHYKVGQCYSIQEGRGKPGLPSLKIELTRKWIEITNTKEAKTRYYPLGYWPFDVILQKIPLSVEDALAEGGYTADEYEVEFKRLNPKWDGIDRVGLEFKVVKIKKGEERQ